MFNVVYKCFWDFFSFLSCLQTWDKNIIVPQEKISPLLWRKKREKCFFRFWWDRPKKPFFFDWVTLHITEVISKGEKNLLNFIFVAILEKSMHYWLAKQADAKIRDALTDAKAQLQKIHLPINLIAMQTWLQFPNFYFIISWNFLKTPNYAYPLSHFLANVQNVNKVLMRFIAFSVQLTEKVHLLMTHNHPRSSTRIFPCPLDRETARMSWVKYFRNSTADLRRPKPAARVDSSPRFFFPQNHNKDPLKTQMSTLRFYS